MWSELMREEQEATSSMQNYPTKNWTTCLELKYEDSNLEYLNRNSAEKGRSSFHFEHTPKCHTHNI